ncbi:HD domain-containing protein [Pilobolus umbonatus]|nr:HD domain-containing protein [Pilobolus umbonatus]
MTSNPSNVIKFFHTIESLKRTKRTGWLDNGVQQAESISDHMHRMGIMAMLITDPAVDRNKCIKMAVVHDLAEAVVGDITPYAGVSKEDKFKLEQDAMNGFRTLLGNTEAANEIIDLWNEYEEGKTSEALLVKDLDKFEMIVQALEYEKSDKKKLQTFFDSTRDKFQHPTVKSWVDALYEERKDLWK